MQGAGHIARTLRAPEVGQPPAASSRQTSTARLWAVQAHTCVCVRACVRLRVHTVMCCACMAGHGVRAFGAAGAAHAHTHTHARTRTCAFGYLLQGLQSIPMPLPQVSRFAQSPPYQPPPLSHVHHPLRQVPSTLPPPPTCPLCCHHRTRMTSPSTDCDKRCAVPPAQRQLRSREGGITRTNGGWQMRGGPPLGLACSRKPLPPPLSSLSP